MEIFSKLVEYFSKQTWFPNLSDEARRGKKKNRNDQMGCDFLIKR